jgi:hypothetical protein
VTDEPVLDHLKANNRAWAERKVATDTGLVKDLGVTVSGPDDLPTVSR